MSKPLTDGRKAMVLYGLTLGCLLLDQVTKAAIRQHLAVGQSIPITPFFNITHVFNKGGAFSLLYGHVNLLALVSLAVAIGLVVYERRHPVMSRWQTIALGILLGGTVGNMVDRFVFGQVTDFLDVFVGTAHFPTFNVADICINLGVALLLVWSYLAPAPVASKESPQ